MTAVPKTVGEFILSTLRALRSALLDGDLDVGNRFERHERSKLGHREAFGTIANRDVRKLGSLPLDRFRKRFLRLLPPARGRQCCLAPETAR
jgi:hypothetical protein